MCLYCEIVFILILECMRVLIFDCNLGSIWTNIVVDNMGPRYSKHGSQHIWPKHGVGAQQRNCYCGSSGEQLRTYCIYYAHMCCFYAFMSSTEIVAISAASNWIGTTTASHNTAHVDRRTMRSASLANCSCAHCKIKLEPYRAELDLSPTWHSSRARTNIDLSLTPHQIQARPLLDPNLNYCSI